MLELYILLILMIIGAIVAVEMEDLFSSIVVFGTVGLLLSLTFIVLKAPDVAITQLVVEILCLLVLVRATIKKDLPFSTSGRWFFNTLITVVFIGMFLTVSWKALQDLPRFGQPLLKVSDFYLKHGLEETGATNLIASIILDYRAYDSLGEAVLLFTAVMGVLAIVRSVGKKKEGVDIPEEDK